MKILGLAVMLVALGRVGVGQAPAGAPAGSTGICKDGTYSTAGSKDGACRGHKGVQSWFGASGKVGIGSGKVEAPVAAAPISTPAPAAPAAQAAPAAAATGPGSVPASAAPTAAAASAAGGRRGGIAAEKAKLAAMQPAAGGGPGLVWVNGSSKVYHCSGSEFYGKTKTGSYMSEADAKAKGAHADHNKPCS